ncbi:MAG TPA: S-methyl-5-thioribose-1-phosphate isomerase [Clostridia bacterium]|nr:S-methyl-5-thioribose-1-phosphate isomerase [Clostridia bacterium]
MDKIQTLAWRNGKLVLLDQTLLPNEICYKELSTEKEVFDAIRTMVVRGAPAIGVSAAYAMVLAAHEVDKEDFEPFIVDYEALGEHLSKSRPTAVNLNWAINRMIKCAHANKNFSVSKIREKLEQEAIAIHNEDLQINRKIGENLLSLLKRGDTVLTHCNAGALATSEYGTALSVFYLAQEKNFPLKAYANETRPRLQGARLTSFELYHAGVDVTLISDNMAAVLMSQGKVDAVIVGCDRVAANGDVANKIGTFNVSILAKHFNIPMYIATPTPTIDFDCITGESIPIEERDGEEIATINGVRIAPEGIKTYNPSFDVTPAENITAIVTEKGIAYPPFDVSLKDVFNN